MFVCLFLFVSRDFVDFEFDEAQYINFTEVSVARKASIRLHAREITTPRAPDEPPNRVSWRIRRAFSPGVH